MTERQSASARVTVTLEIAVHDSWGEDCSVKQVHYQATESAIDLLRNVFDKTTPGWRQHIRIAGTPIVDAVIVTRKSP